MSKIDRYLSRRAVQQRYGISSMTLWRWEHDPRLNFPIPILINGRMYRSVDSLEEWERARPAPVQREGWMARRHLPVSPERRSKGRSFTVKQIALRWNTCERTVRRRIKPGELPAFQIGNRYRVFEADLEAYEARNRAR